ncbi:MAG: signal recognition particle protein [Firmicutes bacterium]|nr:signal recognition particle protein [Bacillota bacterium]
MMFETLTERLQSAFKKLRGKGKLSDADVTEALREVRMALLEADVALKVVKDFTAAVKEKAVGAEVLESLTPAQSVIRIVRDEMNHILGEAAKLQKSQKSPTIYMIVGLQGSGKTTTCGKLALSLKEGGEDPMLAACDIYRPAAIKQLQVLGKELDVPVFSLGDKSDPVQIAKGAVQLAESSRKNIVILDTAGRLHIDENMMSELKRLKAALNPTEILLVADAMTGQDAVKIAERFHQDLTLTGIILTKMDGDARGGAVLSIRAVTGCPVKFVGVGEKLKALEPFYPDRMVSRILGMGDVLTLIEKVEQEIDEKKARELEEKLKKAEFDLDDYLDQLQQIKKMGSLTDLLSMLPGNMFPGLNLQKQLKEVKPDDKQIFKIEAVIRSMTKEERKNPEILNASRKKRVARGSGTEVSDVNQVLKHFDMMKKMMKQFSSVQKQGGKKLLRLPFLG